MGGRLPSARLGDSVLGGCPRGGGILKGCPNRVSLGRVSYNEGVLRGCFGRGYPGGLLGGGVPGRYSKQHE